MKLWVAILLIKEILIVNGKSINTDKNNLETRKKGFFVVARVYPLENLKSSRLEAPAHLRLGSTNTPNNEKQSDKSENSTIDNNINENFVTEETDAATTEFNAEITKFDAETTKSPPSIETTRTRKIEGIEKKKCVCKAETDKTVYNYKESDTQIDDNIESEVKRMFKNFKPPATSKEHDKKHYRLADYIVKYIFKHYPEYEIPLLAKVLANGTTHRAFSGMVMEFQQPNNYDILVTDSYSNVNDGSLRRVDQYPSLYQCSKAIRYCSVNPKFCQYQEGDYDTNVVIVVPHGGNLKPDTIPEREPGCFVNGKCLYDFNCGPVDPEHCPVQTRPEKYSRTIGLRLANNLKNLTGHRPHVIIMDLHRSVIDVDRRQYEGAYSVVTRSAWYDFHNFISHAKLKVPKHGLLIDVHSHLHKHGMVELSYAVTKTQLVNGSDEIDMRASSLRSLVEKYNIDNESVLRGNRSLGGILQNKRIEAVPSPDYPKPSFSGYTEEQTITKLYGSFFGGQMDAIRVSVPRKYGAKRQAKQFSQLLAKSIKEFMDMNYR